MREPIQFSPRLDVQKFNNVRFVLTAIDRRHSDIEISIDCGLTPDEPRMVVATVWARKMEKPARYFLYTEYIPQDKATIEDYVGIAAAIRSSPEFQLELERAYEAL